MTDFERGVEAMRDEVLNLLASHRAEVALAATQLAETAGKLCEAQATYLNDVIELVKEIRAE